MKEKKDKQLEKVERNEVEPTRDGRIYVPETDIYEKDDAILIRCDMPGVAEGQVDIRLDNTELEITATQEINQPKEMDLLMGEYDTGVFRRKFSIPQLIDRDNIRARLQHGVLDIELPKAEQAKPRKIEISTGG
jgi:HSP20 family molecular chaperone IbpA